MKNNVNMKAVEAVAEKFEYDLEKLNRELKRIASAKCNLKKQKFRKDYDEKMQLILVQEQITKEAKMLVQPKKKFVTDFNQDDIAKLDYDETMKAIKSIQSKLFHTAYETENKETYEPWLKAKQIETWLKEHKETVKPVEDAYIRRTDLETIIESIETARADIKVETIIEMLKSL